MHRDQQKGPSAANAKALRKQNTAKRTENNDSATRPPQQDAAGALAPNRSDILAHLSEIAAPAFAHHFADALIEIAHGADGDVNRARLFCAFNLDAAADFAIQMNRQGHNVYVGPALRRGSAQRDKRARGEDVLAAHFCWIEYDDAEGEQRVKSVAKALDLFPVMRVTTGTVPHLRAHLYFEIAEPAGADAATLTKVNAALRAAFGGDAVHDAGRVLRLAGCVNYPTKAKAGRGYVVELVKLDIAPRHRRIAYPAAKLLTINGHASDPSCEPNAAPGAEPEAHPQRVAAALQMIPNEDVSWDDWNRVGMATYRATGGSDEGLAAFDAWSAKSSKYDAATTRRKWEQYRRSPPDQIGAGTLFYLATEADPEWQDKLDARIEAEMKRRNAQPLSFEEFKQLRGRMAQSVNDEARPERDRREKRDASIQQSDDAVAKSSLIVSSAEFVSNFMPPDYLVDGLLQRRFLYSMTAQTNTGKTTVALLLAALVAQGLPLGKLQVEQGKVLFLAGENPDDVRMRWIKLSEDMKFDAKIDKVFWVPGTFSIGKMRTTIEAQAAQHGPFALIVIDSAAAYFEGDDENSNTQFGNYARTLRKFADVSGGPAVIVLSHPTKNATNDNLLPRGGGAFLNEVDGNLVLMPRSEVPKTVELHWHGKFRGPEFSPLSFVLTAGTSECLKDSKGRSIWTITARLQSPEEKTAADDIGQRKRNELLRAMQQQDGLSLAELASKVGWFFKSGEPNKTIADRVMHELAERGLVKMEKGHKGHWKLTKAGRETNAEEQF